MHGNKHGAIKKNSIRPNLPVIYYKLPILYTINISNEQYYE